MPDLSEIFDSGDSDVPWPDVGPKLAALFLGYPEECPDFRPPRRENVESWV